MTTKDVHTRHCCVIHGCKYNEDDTCTVMTCDGRQETACHDCDHEGITIQALVAEFEKIVSCPSNSWPTPTERREFLDQLHYEAQDALRDIGDSDFDYDAVIELLQRAKRIQTIC